MRPFTAGHPLLAITVHVRTIPLYVSQHPIAAAINAKKSGIMLARRTCLFKLRFLSTVTLFCDSWVYRSVTIPRSLVFLVSFTFTKGQIGNRELPGIMSAILKDSYGRAIRDLRVSLTDRCNFRCFYCLPHGEPPIAPKEQMLSYEEIEYVCDIFVELGIEKIRLTGGEPMMRRDIETIIEKLAALKSKGLQDLALTTNGYFLPDRAQGLRMRDLIE